MIYLLLCMLFSALMVFIFKWFSRFRAHTFLAILFNYVAAILIGTAQTGAFPDYAEIVVQPYFPYAFALGFLFVTVFSLMAFTAQRVGATITSVSSRMSLVLPVLFGIMYFSEPVDTLKIIGFVLALPAVFLSSVKPGKEKIKTLYLFLPLLLFIGNGTVDTILSYSQKKLLSPEENFSFIITIFSCALVLGLIYFFISGKFREAKGMAVRSAIAGTALGIFNILALYCALAALGSGEMNSSVFFTFNNIGIIILTAVGSWLLFREKLSWINLLGILVATAVIILTGWETLQEALGF